MAPMKDDLFVINVFQWYAFIHSSALLTFMPSECVRL